MRVLLQRIRELGQVREIHVRVACPPIIAPCFYGIDMPTYSELFAPKHLCRCRNDAWRMTPEIEKQMAEDLGADSIRYLPLESVARAIRIDASHLCRACLIADYPTPWGAKMSLSARETEPLTKDEFRVR